MIKTLQRMSHQTNLRRKRVVSWIILKRAGNGSPRLNHHSVKITPTLPNFNLFYVCQSAVMPNALNSIKIIEIKFIFKNVITHY